MILDLVKEMQDEIPFYREACLKNLFSWQELEHLLNLRPFMNDARFKILNDSYKKYHWTTASWSTDNTAFPPSLIDEEIRNKMCYLIDCSRVNSKVNTVCKDLEKGMGGGVDAHIYFDLSIVDLHPFKIHWDKSHNCIVQIEGQTKWKIWYDKAVVDSVVGEFAFDRGLNHMSTHPKSPYIDVIMNPGDMVFVPAYHWHHAQSQTKRLSISFPFSVKYINKEDRHWIKL